MTDEQHMIAYILDLKYETVDMVDEFQSFIWTERYNSTGDFQLDLRPDSHSIAGLKFPNYLQLMSSDILMCIETYQLKSDLEEGDLVTITGRDLTSILATRKVYYKLTMKDEAIISAVNKIFNGNILDSTKAERKYSFIVRGKDSLVRNLDRKYNGEFIGESCLDAIIEVCDAMDAGIKMLPKLTTAGQMELILYDGVDRSDEQEIVSPVIFTPKYENIVSTEYYEDQTPLPNAALVIGGEHSNVTLMSDGSVVDSDPRDIYAYINKKDSVRDRYRVEATVNASGQSQEDEKGVRLTRLEYATAITKTGNTELDKLKVNKTFTGQIDPYRQFIYRRDFFLGDICTIQDSYGHSEKVRVAEVVHSEDASGYVVTPTFTTLTVLPDPSEGSSSSNIS